MKKKIGITLAVIVLLVCIISVACLAGCKEKVKVDNAQTATEANWAKIDNKSATTTITITGAEIALGVDEKGGKKANITADAKVTLDRTWQDGVLTIKVTAQPSNVELHVDSLGPIGEEITKMLAGYVNFEKMDGLVFTCEAFYNYGKEEKLIGVRNMSATGLRSAIPGLTDQNVTDEPWAIKIDGKSELSFDLGSINLQEGQAAAIVKSLFGEGYVLDLNGIIDGLLLNQTLLDFSTYTEGVTTYQDGQYQNRVKFTDNFKFITEIWNAIIDKASIGSMLSLITVTMNGPDKEAGTEDDVTLDISQLIKDVLGVANFNNLLNDVLGLVEGDMTVTGAVEDGIFTKLKASIPNAKISLDQKQVKVITDIVPQIVTGLGLTGGFVDSIPSLLDQLAGGDAYISFGTIAVDSTFTVNK